MCGIAGIFNYTDSKELSFLESMLRNISHRGPDNTSIFQDNHIILGHNRLSIIDLSDAGNQPMKSFCGNYIIIFNGEIYNRHVLKNEILSHSKITFKGNSDTEIFINYISIFGINKALMCASGMFAFALYDFRKCILQLARDIAGEKPLYFSIKDNVFIFSSELGSILENKLIKKELDSESLELYFRYGYIPSPNTLIKNVKKLNPAFFLEVSIDCNKKLEITQNSYWEATKFFNQTGFINKEFSSIKNNLQTSLIKSIDSLMDADVSIGLFLSGGIDSSLIAAIAKKELGRDIDCFNASFEDSEHDESEKAGTVANHLGLKLHKVSFSQKENIDEIIRISGKFDEPISDPSQVPLYLLAKHARSYHKVCLSGDGADEIFAGYNRHIYAGRYIRLLRGIPTSLKKILTKLIHRNDFALEHILSLFKIPTPQQKILKLRDLLTHDDNHDPYDFLCSFTETATYLKSSKGKKLSTLSKSFNQNFDPSTIMLKDFVNYLPGNVLHKSDRATMAVGLESRAPFLCREIIELGASIPMAYKISNQRQGKYILRNILEDYLPASISKMPKMGFGAPVSNWLRKDLRDWVSFIIDTIDHNDEYIDKSECMKLYNDHLNGRDHSKQIWSILSLQAWRNIHNM